MMIITIAIPKGFTNITKLRARLETAIASSDYNVVYCNNLTEDVFNLLHEKGCYVMETKPEKPHFLIAFWDEKEGEVKDIINECVKAGVRSKIINEV